MSTYFLVFHKRFTILLCFSGSGFPLCEVFDILYTQASHPDTTVPYANAFNIAPAYLPLQTFV